MTTTNYNGSDNLPRIFEMIDDDIILSPYDIATLLCVHVETPRRWCREGKLRTISPIGRYYIRGDDLKDFLKKWHRKKFNQPDRDNLDNIGENT